MRVGRHDTNQRRRFITAYQLWFWMKDENIGFRDRMLQEYPDAVSKGSGGHIGPAQKIAQALGHMQEVETQYIDTRDLGICDIFPAAEMTAGCFD